MKVYLLTVWLILPSVSWSFTWSDLWLTPNQQGQKLMRIGEFKKAEATFQQQDWRAAAAYRAGNFQEAAHYYASQHNEAGYYNLGNALAHLKQYQKAINAYDKALALNPKNKAALANRKLLEELMKNTSANQSNKNQQNEQQQNQSGKDQQGKDQQGKDQQGKDQQGKDQQGKDQQGKDQQGKDQQGKDQQGKDQQGKDQQGKDQQNKTQKKQSPQVTKEKKQNLNDKIKNPENIAASEMNGQSEDEKQQAKEQWLRLIPDDPGGLIREKFLRDHLRRQSDGE